MPDTNPRIPNRTSTEPDPARQREKAPSVRALLCSLRASTYYRVEQTGRDDIGKLQGVSVDQQQPVTSPACLFRDRCHNVRWL